MNKTEAQAVKECHKKKGLIPKEIQEDTVQILAEDSSFLCNCEEVIHEIQTRQRQQRR